MCDFEKKFRSCGKVTSLSLSVNAISREKISARTVFPPNDFRQGCAPSWIALDFSPGAPHADFACGLLGSLL
jgi:hypothetical protein